ncbi:hypothetical protein CUJ83_00085 [Methanocella sp. CWC-04]|uniref:Uncharacterized protein n=1 Tax=Methanooceanicella nereidis TaxID=2052831 RepID=A0AAP2W5R5_9EURY|nr:hypothetical protein [Methanocella sp. CWC-04]MCD1293396.1 hypothetical protein [Methanocella sp. CWC-04]
MIMANIFMAMLILMPYMTFVTADASINYRSLPGWMNGVPDISNVSKSPEDRDRTVQEWMDWRQKISDSGPGSQRVKSDSENFINKWNRTRGYGNAGIENGSLECVCCSPDDPSSNFGDDRLAFELIGGDGGRQMSYGKPCEGLCGEKPRTCESTGFLKMTGFNMSGEEMTMAIRSKK